MIEMAHMHARICVAHLDVCRHTYVRCQVKSVRQVCPLPPGRCALWHTLEAVAQCTPAPSGGGCAVFVFARPGLLMALCMGSM